MKDAGEDEKGSSREIPPNEFTRGAIEALMDLVICNPLFEQFGVEARGVSCIDAGYLSREEEDDIEENSDPSAPQMLKSEEDDCSPELDDFETGLYLYRWPNGDFSIVKAENREDAILRLDEWDAAHSSWLVPLDKFMVDFKLNGRGEIELRAFGEETENFVQEYCYPELERVLMNDVTDDATGTYSAEDRKKIRAAVRTERKRLWNNQPQREEAETEVGRELQRQMGAAGPVANHYIKLRAKKILQSKLGEDGKPN